MRSTLLSTLFLLAAVFPGTSQSADNVIIAHCLQGCPQGTSANNEIIVRHLYAVSVNPQTRLADWVSYRVVPGSIGVASLLPRDWQNDGLARNSVRVDELSGEGKTLVQPNLGNQPESVYRISEFSVNAGDRGRLVPMTSFAGTSYWSDLNLLSIMSVMKSDLRLESWSRLDQAVNALVGRAGELFVVAGPVYPDNAGADAVPEAFFKVVASRTGELAAFVFDQNLPAHAGYCEQLSDLNRVESLTGLDLFPAAGDWPVDSLVRSLGC